MRFGLPDGSPIWSGIYGTRMSFVKTHMLVKKYTAHITITVRRGYTGEYVKISLPTQQPWNRGYMYEGHGFGRFEFVYGDGSVTSAYGAIAVNDVYPVQIHLPVISATPAFFQYEYMTEPKIGFYNQAGLPAGVFRLRVES